MYWVMASERSDEYERSMDQLPPMYESLELHLDQGNLVPNNLPSIDIPFTQHPEEYITDNIVVPMRMGLLINNKVKTVFDRLGISNIQYFKARLIDQATQTVDENYYVANIIGSYACVDHAESELELFDDGSIEFIDKLVLKLDERNDYEHVFRLAEFPALLIISQMLKDSLLESKITGFKFYEPSEFSL